MKRTFTLDDVTYTTDAETYAVLREQVKAHRVECVAAIMALGLKAGRIKEDTR